MDYPFPHTLVVASSKSHTKLSGFPQVKLTLGEYENFKLTTPEDMVIAEQILDARK
jgi:2-C-methyl-D-erythritol 4-phosphate cytidylyltransferase